MRSASNNTGVTPVPRELRPTGDPLRKLIGQGNELEQRAVGQNCVAADAVNVNASSDLRNEADLRSRVAPEAAGARRQKVNVGSWNILQSFWDDFDKTDDHRHFWMARQAAVRETIVKQSPDVLGLQELTHEQALWMEKTFPGYECLFFMHTPAEAGALGIVQAKDIATWKKGENLSEWKHLGTPMTGIMVKEGWKIDKAGGFWLKPTPNERPPADDKTRGATGTDKGFGNRNTYRGVMWVKLEMPDTGKSLYVFNSHYPLTLDPAVRRAMIHGCARVEREQIEAITQGADWVSVGDRNILPLDNNAEIQHADLDAISPLLDGAFNAVREETHKGPATTWAGCTYDEYANPVVDGHLVHRTMLDVIVSNKPADKSKTVLTQISALTGGIQLNPEQVDPARRFASDHLYVQAKYTF